MTRYFKYIFISLIACIGLASCVEKMEMPNLSDESLEVALVPRVKGFSNQYVTKSSYSAGEDVISRLAVMVFNPVTGNLVYRKEYPEATKTTPIILNRSMINLESATVVMFANISLSDIKKPVEGSTTEFTTLATDNVSLSTLKDYTCHFTEANTVIASPLPTTFKGFPMIGATPGINLTSTSTDPVVVNLKVLYSKISFNISVANGTENIGTTTPSFTLSNYKVFNASKATALSYPKTTGEPERDVFGNVSKGEDGNDVIASQTTATASADYAYLSTSAGFAGTATGTATLGSTNNNVSFTFYVAEGRFNHNSDLTGIYPDDSWLISTADTADDDVKGYSSLSDDERALPENKLNGVKYFYDDYIQQYKPKLAEVSTGAPAAGLATYVQLNGSYTDYRGTVWNVAYKVYLGKDNAHNFHVDRNSEYINNITIKGIRNNDSYGAGDVWVDHRVNVSTTDPSGAVAITRETLLDSHIEVRPLRVSWPGNTYDGVRVYLPTENGALVNWIGIERFTGDNCLDGAVYCYVGGQATGKRKYFTTSLIGELQSMGGEYGVQTSKDNQKYIYLLNGECAWIYFDENTTGSIRPADIKLEFYKSDGKFVTETYHIKQAAIQTVSGYSIETYEEYLHSYDSADKYNLSTTPADYTQQGLAWGLTNTSVSETQIASATALPGLNYYSDAQYVKDIRYDFWHKSDGNYNVYSSSNSWGALSDDAKNKETGLAFTNRATENRQITIIDMGTKPSNAYQYCLSKNKFKEDASGNHTLDIHWYMPDVHELEAVLKANLNAADFKSDAYYWSSQPSYTDQINSDVLDYLAGLFGGEVAIVDENVEYARAASSTSTKGADVLRTTNNRIRCFYSAEGVKNVDMSERVPDGLGGNFTFWMKGWTDNTKTSPGFFSYLLPSPSTTTNSTGYSYPNVTYPTKENSYNVEGAEFTYFVAIDNNDDQVEGFLTNPSTNWSEYYFGLIGTGYYTTLGRYPGLVNEELKKITGGDYTNVDAWQQISGTRKSVSENATITTVRQLTNSNLSATDLESLDHISGGSLLDISFAIGDGSANPAYVYDELVMKSSTTNTKYWTKPTYEQSTYQAKPDTRTITFTATATHTGGKYGEIAGYDIGKASAFGNFVLDLGFLGSWSFSDGAYDKAKEAALQGVKDIIEASYSHYSYNYNNATYTSLKWSDGGTGANDNPKYEVVESSRTGKKYKCTCTVTCSLEITLAGTTKTYYKPPTGAGWSDPATTSTTDGPTINSDQLTFYSGNSFTISVTDSNYEITKIKVYYSGDNKVASGIMGDGIFNQRQTDVYARFVTPNILSDDTIVKEKEIYVVGSAEPLQLPGMDYSEDGSAGWQQWTGDGQSSVTLVLADYAKVNNVISNLYKYQTAKTKLSESIIIDRIEVKCTKKATIVTE